MRHAYPYAYEGMENRRAVDWRAYTNSWSSMRLGLGDFVPGSFVVPRLSKPIKPRFGDVVAPAFVVPQHPAGGMPPIQRYRESRYASRTLRFGQTNMDSGPVRFGGIL